MIERKQKPGQIPNDEAIRFAADLLEVTFERARAILIDQAVEELSNKADEMSKVLGLDHEEKADPSSKS